MDKKVYKSFGVEIKEKDETKREITAIGSQEKIDRDGDVVIIDGVDLKNYKKNPVVLWSHRAGDPPIGKAVKVWKEDGKLMFKLQFPEPETYSFADTIYKLLKEGYLNSFSIGFSPDWKTAEFQEKAGGYKFHNSELLEISVCNVPANPGALVHSKSFTKALEDEIIDDIELKEIEEYLKHITAEPEPVEEKVEEKVEVKDETSELKQMIVELQNKITALESKIAEQKCEIKPSYLDEIFNDLLGKSLDDKSESDKKSNDEDIDQIVKNYFKE